MEDLTTRVDPSSDGGDPDERGVRLPARIGRYEVLARLGQGGMGVVCTAYDDRLERKVAIKLLSRGPRGGTDDSTRVSRLEREAQALAQISHPNVLQVFEVGRYEAQVYIVLEYVKGSTLGVWCRAAPRSWRAVLEKYLQAGEGLQAAHAVGIVHRDFKPDNALVDAAGRVRVMDFGLARVGLAPEPASGGGETATAQTSERSSPTLELSLTSPGAVLGTPAYMAPEQFRGEDVDARTDVYCFCVALWEALFGARPFRGRDLAELRADVLSGRAPTARAGRRVSAWL
jgi:eukaryotic-like serine/threonine-protein kinase